MQLKIIYFLIPLALGCSTTPSSQVGKPSPETNSHLWQDLADIETAIGDFSQDKSRKSSIGTLDRICKSSQDGFACLILAELFYQSRELNNCLEYSKIGSVIQPNDSIYRNMSLKCSDPMNASQLIDSQDQKQRVQLGIWEAEKKCRQNDSPFPILITLLEKENLNPKNFQTPFWKSCLHPDEEKKISMIRFSHSKDWKKAYSIEISKESIYHEILDISYHGGYSQEPETEISVLWSDFISAKNKSKKDEATSSLKKYWEALSQCPKDKQLKCHFLKKATQYLLTQDDRFKAYSQTIQY